MLEQEIKNLWKNAPEEYQVNIDKTMLIFRMDKELGKMNRLIKFRNILEMAIGIMVTLVFSYLFYIIAIPLFRIGIILTWIAALYSLYRIYATRSLAKKVDTGSSIFEQLELSKKYWTSESLLLNTEYIRVSFHLPGYACLIWATTGGATILKFIFILPIALLIAGVYFMNQYAEKKSIQPLLKNIDEAIVRLKE